MQMRRQVGVRRVLHSVVAVLLLFAGTTCMPNIKEDPKPVDKVQPIFDSVAGTIPLPNDAALDEQGTLPDLDAIDEDSAQGEFHRWLTTLHGWLPSTGIEIPFNGELDEKTIDKEDFRLFRVKQDGSLETLEIDTVEYEAVEQRVADENDEIVTIDGSMITVVPKEPLEPLMQYAVVGTKDIEDPNGRRIIEPQAIFFAASEEPLVDENGEKTIDSLPDDETAQSLEALRQSLEPIFDGAAAKEGIERSDVGIAFGWSTVKDPKTIVDPATATLPLPNTAALDEDGTFPKAALDNVDEDTAQGHFEQYLDRLHGWPPTTPITLPIQGDVDSGTLGPESVQLWAMKGENDMPEQFELEEVNYDEEAGEITLVPKKELPKRTRYVAFATNEVKNADGLSLKLPAALRMAIQPFDVLENGSSTVNEIPDADAQSIAGLRQFLRPAAQFIEMATDATLEDLGAVWTWQTWTDTFVVFDPAGGVLSFPNEFLRRGMNGRVSIPTEGLSGLQKTLIEELNKRQGFSTTAPAWIPLDGKIDPQSLTDESLKYMFISGTPTVYDASRYEVAYESDWDQIVTRLNDPWMKDPATDPTMDDFQNAGVVTTELMGTNGHPVRPSPAFVFLRSPKPLVDSNGNSKVDQLDDMTAQQLEPARQTFNTLLGFAPAIPDLNVKNREEVALAWAFHPENSTQPVQELRAQALAKVDGRSSTEFSRACEPNCSMDPNQVDDPGSSYQGPDGMGDAVDMSNVQTIQWAAEFDTVNFLDMNNRIVDFMSASDETIGASVFVPKTNGNCSPPFKVVIAQHGLGGSRIGPGMAMANELAGQCLATVTIDFPKHGGRSPSSMDLHPDTKPMNSGMGYFSTDLVGTVNNAKQSIVDVAVLAEIIQRDGLETAIDDDTNTDLFAYNSDEEIGYVAQSLGGFVGFPFLSVDSNVTVGVFNATGGKYSRVLFDGSLGGDLEQVLEMAGLMEGTFERFQAESFVQWIAEHIDPFSFAPFIKKEPLDETTYDPMNGSFSSGDTLESNEVLMQMSQNPMSMDDEVVPNATTELLANSAGFSLADSTYTAEHGFLYETDQMSADFKAADCARRQAAAWVGSGLGGTAMFPDNLKASNCTSN